MKNKSFSELYPELAAASIEYCKNKKNRKKTTYNINEKPKNVVIEKPCDMNIFKNLFK